MGGWRWTGTRRRFLGTLGGLALLPALPAWGRLATAPESLTVVIDPGHGGHDPGAIGRAGLREKDVVLDIGRQVVAHLRQVRGVRVLMTRDRDVFVPLKERLHRGIGARAQLFVSLHADAFPVPDVRGSSVWTLSPQGASSSAARWLAQSQNAGIRFWDGPEIQNPLLRSTLMDLTQAATLSSAAAGATAMLRALSAVEGLHSARVQHANFVVLRAPNVPSMLVETAFLSNPEEEQRLADPGFRRVLAEAISQGILAHLTRHPAESARHEAASGLREQLPELLTAPGLLQD